MQLKAKEKDKALNILTQLLRATSKENYNNLYLELNMTCSDKLISYFDRNWHNIRYDWPRYCLLQNSFSNETNNRLESVNAKIKLVMEKNSPLITSVKDLFEWYDSHKTESHLRTANQFIRKPNVPFDINDDGIIIKNE